MEICYFTFGSDKAYPYGRGEYVMVIGNDRSDCIAAYRKHHPNRPGSDCFNAADCYTHKKWTEEICPKYYMDAVCRERLVSDTVYGKKPEGFEPIWIFVPAQSAILFLQEGSEYLEPEDKEKGFIGYVDYSIYNMDVMGGKLEEDEFASMYLFDEATKKTFTCLADAIPGVLDSIYDYVDMDVQILQAKRHWFEKG